MTRQLDLRELATPRGNAGPVARRTGGSTRWLTRYLLPFLLLCGFVGTLVYSMREAFLPAKGVRVIPVMAVQAEIAESESPLFQSAGWVEPRPTPVIVS